MPRRFVPRASGFTLTEILIVVAILVIISTMVGVSISRYTRTQALAGVTGAIVSQIEDARSRTLSSQGGSQYGVHIATGAATLFRGDTYASNDPLNETTPLDSRTEVAMALAGGGANIVFERLTGETDMPGTITVSLAAVPALSKTITIQQTGLVSYEK